MTWQAIKTWEKGYFLHALNSPDSLENIKMNPCVAFNSCISIFNMLYVNWFFHCDYSHPSMLSKLKLHRVSNNYLISADVVLCLYIPWWHGTVVMNSTGWNLVNKEVTCWNSVNNKKSFTCSAVRKLSNPSNAVQWNWRSKLE